MNDFSNIFKALGDETRLIIFSAIKDNKELCACKLLELVNCNQSTLSHHMRILVDSGLVVARKDWKWVHYSLNPETINELINFFK